MLPDNPRQLDHDYDAYITAWLEDLPEFEFEENDRIERD